jgi:hypothetical protein
MLYRELIPLVKSGSAARPFLLHRITTGRHLKIARAIPILSGVAAVAVAIMTAAPALAGPVNSSALCLCQAVTGNTVWRNRVTGLYVNASRPAARSYLAVIAGR